MLRKIDKNDVSKVLDALTDRVTFAQAKRLLKLPQKTLSELLRDLEFFRLVDHEGQYYQTNQKNRLDWERYDRECDYRVFKKSDDAKRYHESMGINTDVYEYEKCDLKAIDYCEGDNDSD